MSVSNINIDYGTCEFIKKIVLNLTSKIEKFCIVEKWSQKM